MKQPNSFRWLVVLGTLTVLLAFPARSGPTSDEELGLRYAGEYRFSGGAAERALIPPAVERSVDGMFFIARGIAYDRLIKVCHVCTSYQLSFSASEVTIEGPCQLPDRSPADGGAVDHKTKEGDTSKLTQRFVDGTLVQEFAGDQGSQRVVWRLQPDGETLSVQFTITSSHLPHAVDYTLSYRRVKPSAPDAGPMDAGTAPGG